LISPTYILWVLLTSALRAMVKESKKEIIVKFHVEKVVFYYFNKLNAQFPRKGYYFKFLSKCP